MSTEPELDTALDKVTRVEVIGSNHGRMLVLYNVCDVRLAIQDYGRTLKVFLSEAAD